MRRFGKNKALLMDEASVAVSPSLATAFGLPAAAFLQQLHYSIVTKTDDPDRYTDSFHEGYFWSYDTTQAWLKKMPYLGSSATFNRMTTELRNCGVLVVGNFNKYDFDKTNWFRIDYDNMDEVAENRLKEHAARMREQEEAQRQKKEEKRRQKREAAAAQKQGGLITSIDHFDQSSESKRSNGVDHFDQTNTIEIPETLSIEKTSSSATQKKKGDLVQKKGKKNYPPLEIDKNKYKKVAEDIPAYSVVPSGENLSIAGKQKMSSDLVEETSAMFTPPKRSAPPTPAKEIVQHFVETFAAQYPDVLVNPESSGAAIGKAKALLATCRGDLEVTKRLITFWISQFHTIKSVQKLGWDKPSIGGLNSLASDVFMEMHAREKKRAPSEKPDGYVPGDDKFNLNKFFKE